MAELLLHKDTKKQLDGFISGGSHALIIVGAKGSGKGEVAAYLAAKLLKIDKAELDRGQVLLIKPSAGFISIDEIRRAQKFMQLKTLGKNPIRRVLVVSQAQKLTDEAQNAFLKLLEEPPADSVILLTAEHTSSLLPTILSRAQHISVKPVPQALIISYFKDLGHKAEDVQKAYHIADGRLGLLASILGGEGTQKLAYIDEAKRLLAKTSFEKLLQTDKLAAQKDELAKLLDAFDVICHAALAQTAARGDNARFKRWFKSLKAVSEARENLRYNPNRKLHVTNLLLDL